MFNSDVLDRLAVAVDLTNAASQGQLPGGNAHRPDHIFGDRGYQPPRSAAEWNAIAQLAVSVGEVLHLAAAGEHDRAIARLNHDLRSQHVIPQVETHNDTWTLHFHTPDADFARGWAAGISAALAIAYGVDGASRLGECSSLTCTNLFLDRGRNQQRRYCSLRCQNQAKSAAYRHRRSST